MIRVFTQKTKATPTDERVYFTGPPLEPLKERDVFVSCTFTYYKEKTFRIADQWDRQGYNVQVGGPAFDDPGGDFVPGRFLKPGYVITSRGCNNKCWFCYVHKREGLLREIPITDGWNLQDNNLLQCSEDHIRAVFSMLKRQKEKARFTGGLEARLLQDWHIDLLVDLNPHLMFFAYDTSDDFEPLIIAVNKLKKAGYTGRRLRVKVACYVLIGYPKDTMDKAQKRLSQVLGLGITPFAMLYRNDGGKISREWAKIQREWFRPSIIYGKRSPHRIEAEGKGITVKELKRGQKVLF